jgi:hypothetical protein
MDGLSRSMRLLNTEYKIYAQVSSSGTDIAEEHLVIMNRQDLQTAAYAS